MTLHSVLLFPQVPGPDYLREHVESGALRAAFTIRDGDPVQAMAFAMAENTESLSRTKSLVCPGDPGCLDGLLAPLPRVPSVYEPGEINIFALLQIACGRTREVERHLLDRQDMLFAAAHVLGLAELDLIVEVTGDDLDDVRGRLLELTDLDAFTSCRTLVIDKADTVGWGDGRALAG